MPKMDGNFFIHKTVVVLFFIVFNFYVFCSQNIKDTLSKIPKDEKEQLEMLFRGFFNGEHFSYTLFGDKPMSISNYSNGFFDKNETLSKIRCKYNTKTEWNTWKKYELLFPMTRYLLIEVFQKSENSNNIYFINKKYFIHTIDKYANLFQPVFGEDITGYSLLKKIEEDPSLLLMIEKHQLLLGILLGYGEHNARLYDKRDELSPFVWRRKFPEIPIKPPLPSPGFSSLKEEFNAYFSVLTCFGDYKYSPLMIKSVHFAADHKHRETKKLKRKYEKMRGDISSIYAKGDFLEITLLKLTEE